jgi:hypothetical protein
MICLPSIARRTAASTVVIVSAALGLPSVLAAAPPASANWSTTQKVSVADKAVGMTAFTVEIPSGWKYAGMILRPGGCHAPAVPALGLSFSTVGPDGITAYSSLPGVSWDWVSDGTSLEGPKCKPINITTAAGFLLNIVIPNMRPDARNITVLPLPPQMQAGLAAQRQNLQAQSGGANGRRTIDAARVRLEYQLEGHPVEELLGAIITCEEHDMPAYPQLHRPAVTRRNCQSRGTNIRRAPKGGLDALISKNLPPPQIDPAWDFHIQQQMRSSFASWQKANDIQFQEIQDHYKQVTAGMIKRGQDAQAQLQDQTNHAMAQDRATQRAIDHAAQQQVRDSLNRADFIDPNTGRKIETSNQFTHNWINSSGDTVALGSDATFDPNGTLDPVRQSWTELIPIN